MPGEPIKIGVIGAGGMGGRHAVNLGRHVPGAKLAALMDLDANRTEALATSCGGAKIFTDAGAMIAADEVEAVIIASPDPTHADLALACLDAGKPVLCEKPLATNLAAAQAVVEAENEHGERLIQLGFMRVYDPAHRAIEDALRSGIIGRPLLFRGLHSNLAQDVPRTVADVITNSAVHDFHTARWLMDDEVSTVFASHVPVAPAKLESCRLLLVQLQFAKGAIGSIEVDVAADYGYEVTVTVAGEKGRVKAPTDPGVILCQDQQKGQAVPADWLQRFDAAYIIELQGWVRSLQGQRQRIAAPSAWDGYMSLAIADACLRSIADAAPASVQVMDKPALYRP